MKNQKSVIIKKVKKITGGGHHGGAWKVAYADFVTAMMAFFLLMWLLNMSSPEKRVRLSTYFKTFSIFTSGGTSMIGAGSNSIFNESGQNEQKAMSDYYGDANKKNEGIRKDKGKGKRKEKGEGKRKEKLKRIRGDIDLSGMGVIKGALQDDIKSAAETDYDKEDGLGDIQDQIMVDIAEGGVRIQLADTEGNNMFESGSSKLTPKARKIFKLIGKTLNPLPNRISVEGHTDSVPYAGRKYSNWELSTDRALMARKELESNGLNKIRFARVSGYAGMSPLIEDNPSDPNNRRISIIIKDEVIPELVKPPVEESKEKPVKKTTEKKIDNGKAALNKLKEKEDNISSPKTKWKPVKKNVEQGPVIEDVLIPINNETVKSPVIDNNLNPVMKNSSLNAAKKTVKPDKLSEPPIEKTVTESELKEAIKNKKEYISKKIKEKSANKKSRGPEKTISPEKTETKTDTKNEWGPAKKNGDQGLVLIPMDNETIKGPVFGNDLNPVIKMEKEKSSSSTIKKISKPEKVSKPPVEKAVTESDLESMRIRKKSISKKIKEKSAQKKLQEEEMKVPENTDKTESSATSNNGWKPVLNSGGLNPFQ